MRTRPRTFFARGIVGGDLVLVARRHRPPLALIGPGGIFRVRAACVFDCDAMVIHHTWIWMDMDMGMWRAWDTPGIRLGYAII